MHTRIVTACLAVALVAAAASSAIAQTVPPASPLVVHGQAGLTFGGPSGGLFGAGAGARVGAVPGLTIFGEFGRLTNVMTDDLQDFVDDVAGVDESDDFDFEFEMRLPATYGFGGARYQITTNGPLGVFVEGGLGFAHVTSDVSLTVDGIDFSDEFEETLEESDDVLSTTEMLLVVGGGVSYPVTPRADLTGGLRINRIAAADGITKTAVYVGVLWRP